MPLVPLIRVAERNLMKLRAVLLKRPADMQMAIDDGAGTEAAGLVVGCAGAAPGRKSWRARQVSMRTAEREMVDQHGRALVRERGQASRGHAHQTPGGSARMRVGIQQVFVDTNDLFLRRPRQHLVGRHDIRTERIVVQQK